MMPIKDFYNPLPKKLQIDVTSSCNSRCPQCPRTFEATLKEHPGIIQEDFSIEDIDNVLSDPYMKDISRVFMNGNYGDFVMYKNPKELIEHVLSYNNINHIKINTNGGALPSKFWKWLGTKSKVTVEFSIDGLEDTHSLYRRNTRFDVVLDNATTFINAGGRAIWSMVVFKHNEHQIDDCRKLAKTRNFFQFIMRPSPRWVNKKDKIVYDNNYNPLYKLEPASFVDKDFSKYEESDKHPTNYFEKRYSFLSNTTEPNLENPDLTESSVKIDCSAKKTSTIYIGADGRLWPCCWMEVDTNAGIYTSVPRTFNWHFYKKLKKTKDFNNVKVHSISKIISEFKLLSEIQHMIDNNSCDTCRKYCLTTDNVNTNFQPIKEKI